jgi:hypothetical protein
MERDVNAPSELESLARPARAAVPRPSARATAVLWLRRTHGWIGLWGAALGLLFGASGIWLNHRSVLPLQVAQVRTNSQLALPEPPPANAAALAAWAQEALHLEGPPGNVRIEPARPAAWDEQARSGRGADARNPAASSPGRGAPAALMQPEHWTLNFGGPQATTQVEYWVGNRSASVRRTESGLLGTLTNLHKGVGMPVGWILLVDTLAGSILLLSLSGLALWLLTRRRWTVGLAICGASCAVTAALVLSRL